METVVMDSKTMHGVSMTLAPKGDFLPVMEHFYTLQGEGYYQGQAAYFIRLAGCDVGCHWCDVKDSWNAALHPTLSVADLVKQVAPIPAPIVVITGGEPLMHNLDHLTQLLRAAGKNTHIETSGAYPLSGQWNWICLSPKKFKLPLPEVIAAANELKVVIYNKHDLEWAELYAAQVNPQCLLYLQPEWSKAAQVTPLIVEYVKQHRQWRVSLQVHKYMDIP